MRGPSVVGLKICGCPADNGDRKCRPAQVGAHTKDRRCRPAGGAAPSVPSVGAHRRGEATSASMWASTTCAGWHFLPPCWRPKPIRGTECVTQRRWAPTRASKVAAPAYSTKGWHLLYPCGPQKSQDKVGIFGNFLNFLRTHRGSRSPGSARTFPLFTSSWIEGASGTFDRTWH